MSRATRANQTENSRWEHRKKDELNQDAESKKVLNVKRTKKQE